MSNPTIDEMLAYLDHRISVDRLPMDEAIRGILEQHNLHTVLEKHKHVVDELEAIRAFVERVHKRADEILANDKTQELFSEHFMQAFLDELKAMKKQTE